MREICFEASDVTTAVFYGLGADGTVGANKNSIKIIGEETDLFARATSSTTRRSRATTVSHLRFGSSPHPLRTSSESRSWRVIQFSSSTVSMCSSAPPDGAVFLLNAPYPASEIWDRLPARCSRRSSTSIRCYHRSMRRRSRSAPAWADINTIMQTCFFAISGVLPRDETIAQIKRAIDKTYRKRGAEVIRRNYAAVDATLAYLEPVQVPVAVSATQVASSADLRESPDFVQKVTSVLLGGKGDLLPVSAFPVDGTWPVGTAKWEKRNWRSRFRCGMSASASSAISALVCPHSAIRAKVYPGAPVDAAPETFKSTPIQRPRLPGTPTPFRSRLKTAPAATCVRLSRERPHNPRHKAIDMVRRRRCAMPRSVNFVLPRPAEAATHRPEEVRSQDVAIPRAAVRVLGRLLGMR